MTAVVMTAVVVMAAGVMAAGAVAATEIITEAVGAIVMAGGDTTIITVGGVVGAMTIIIIIIMAAGAMTMAMAVATAGVTFMVPQCAVMPTVLLPRVQSIKPFEARHCNVPCHEALAGFLHGRACPT